MSPNVVAGIANVVLVAAAGSALGRANFKRFSDYGMHGVFALHGLAGALENFGVSVGDFYKFSRAAAFYLPLASVNADLYRDNQTISLVHMLSGAIPFVLALTGDNSGLGELVNILNLCSMSYYAFDKKQDNAWFVVGASVFTYFITPLIPDVAAILSPLGMTAMTFTGFKLLYGGLVELDAVIKNVIKSTAWYFPLSSLMVDVYQGGIMSYICLISSLVPFVFELTETETNAGAIVNGFNIFRLSYFAYAYSNDAAWILACASIFTYFVTPLTAELESLLCPLGMIVMTYTGFRILHPIITEIPDPRRRRK